MRLPRLPHPTTTTPPPPPPPAPPKVEEKDAYPSTVLGYPLRRLKHLVDVVHDWVNKNKTGRIDWEAIGRAMSLPHGGRGVVGVGWAYRHL